MDRNRISVLLNSNKKGAVLMYTVMIITLLSVVAISMTLLAVNSYASASRDSDAQQAYYVAKMIGVAIANEYDSNSLDIKDFLETIYDANVAVSENGFSDRNEVTGTYDIAMPDGREYEGNVTVTFAGREKMYFTVSATVNGYTSIIRSVFSCLDEVEFENEMESLLDTYQIYLTDPNNQSFEFCEETAGTPSVYLYNALYDEETVDSSADQQFYIRSNINSILTITGGSTLVNDTGSSVNIGSNVTGYGSVILESVNATKEIYVNGNLTMKDYSDSDTIRGGSVGNAYVRGDVNIEYNSGPTANGSTTIFSTGNVTLGSNSAVSVSRLATAANIYAQGAVRINKASNVMGWIYSGSNVTIGQYSSYNSAYDGKTTIYGNIYSEGNVTIYSDVVVTGNVQAKGNVTIYGKVKGDVIAGDTLNIRGVSSPPSIRTTITGNVKCNKLNCTDNNGATIAGNVYITGAGDCFISKLNVQKNDRSAYLYLTNQSFSVKMVETNTSTNRGFVIDNLYFRTGIGKSSTEPLDLGGYTVGNLYQQSRGNVYLSNGTITGSFTGSEIWLRSITASGEIESIGDVYIGVGCNISGSLSVKQEAEKNTVTIASGTTVTGLIKTYGKVVVHRGATTSQATVIMNGTATALYNESVCTVCNTDCASQPHRVCLGSTVYAATISIADFNTTKDNYISNLTIVGSNTSDSFTLTKSVTGNFSIDCSRGTLSLANNVSIGGELYTRAKDIVANSTNTVGSVYIAGTSDSYTLGFKSIKTDVYAPNSGVVIPEGTQVGGKVYTTKATRIDGTVTGTVKVNASTFSNVRLTVGSTGKINGSVDCSTLELKQGGTISGNVYCRHYVASLSSGYRTIVSGTISGSLIADHSVQVTETGSIGGDRLVTYGSTSVAGSLSSNPKTTVICRLGGTTSATVNIATTIFGDFYATAYNTSSTTPQSSFVSPITLGRVDGEVKVNGGELHITGNVAKNIYNSNGGSTAISKTQKTTIYNGVTVSGNVQVAGDLDNNGTIIGEVKCGGNYGIDTSTYDWNSRDYSCSGDLTINVGSTKFCALNVGGTLTINTTGTVTFTKDIVCKNLILNSSTSLASAFSNSSSAVGLAAKSSSYSSFKVQSGQSISFYIYERAIICNFDSGSGTNGKTTFYVGGAAIFKYCNLYSLGYGDNRNHMGWNTQNGSFWTGTKTNTTPTYLVNSNVYSNMHTLSGGLYLHNTTVEASDNISEGNYNGLTDAQKRLYLKQHYISGTLTLAGGSWIKANNRSNVFTGKIGDHDWIFGRGGTIVQVSGSVVINRGCRLGANDIGSRYHQEAEIGLFASGSLTIDSGAYVTMSLFVKGTITNNGRIELKPYENSAKYCGGMVYCGSYNGSGYNSVSEIDNDHVTHWFTTGTNKHKPFAFKTNGSTDTSVISLNYQLASNFVPISTNVGTSCNKTFKALDTSNSTSGGTYSAVPTISFNASSYMIADWSLTVLTIDTVDPSFDLKDLGIITLEVTASVQTAYNSNSMKASVKLDMSAVNATTGEPYWNPKALPYIWSSPRSTADGSITDLATWIENNRADTGYQMTYKILSTTGGVLSNAWNSHGDMSSTQWIFNDGRDTALRDANTDMVVTKTKSVVDSVTGPIVNGLASTVNWLVGTVTKLLEAVSFGTLDFSTQRDAFETYMNQLKSAANPPDTITAVSFFESGIINTAALTNSDYMTSLDNYFKTVNDVLGLATRAVNSMIDIINSIVTTYNDVVNSWWLGWLNLPDISYVPHVDYTIPDAYYSNSTRNAVYSNYWGFQRGTATYGDCRMIFYACNFNGTTPLENTARDLHIIVPADFNMSWFNDSDNGIQIVGQGRVYLYLEDNVRMSFNGLGKVSSDLENSFLNNLDWFDIGNNFAGFHYDKDRQDYYLYKNNSTQSNFNERVYWKTGNNTIQSMITSLQTNPMKDLSSELYNQLYFIGCGSGIELDFQGYNVAAFIYLPSGESRAIDKGYSQSSTIITEYVGINSMKTRSLRVIDSRKTTQSYTNYEFYENRVILDVSSKYSRAFIGALVVDNLMLGTANDSQNALNKLTFIKARANMSDTYLLSRVSGTRGQSYSIGEFLSTPSALNPIYLDWYFAGYMSV